jgi:acetyl esterase/lipase
MLKMTRREFGLSAGAASATLAASALGAKTAIAAGTDATFDVMPYVHPELRQFVGPMLARARSLDLRAETLPMIQKQVAQNAAPAAAAEPAWSERMIPGPRGAPDLWVFIVNASRSGPPRPAILHMHGGGFILGRARDELPDVQTYATALDCVIVTVDYRLAPQTPFPGPLEDNYAALKWLYANADQLGVDPKRIAVMGGSAGGGHAAMLAIAARDRGEIPLVYQALIYPMLDDRTGSTIQRPRQQGALAWTPAWNRLGWSSLLGVPAGSANVPDGAVPARVKDLRGLPAAFIGVGSIDLFVDEDIAYADRLIEAGVSVTLDVVPGGFHGFQTYGTPIGKRFNAALINAVRDGLAPAS